MVNRRILMALILCAPTMAFAQAPTSSSSEVFDAGALEKWSRTGDANWTRNGDVIEANKGSGHLVSAKPYTNFYLRAEVWVDETANSGIFIRCQDAKKPATNTGYEVNIFDTRKDPSYGTGAIVDVAKVDPMPKAGGKWNILEITAEGPVFTVILNGQKTVDRARDEKFAKGYISLQYGAGVVKFRRIEIKEL